MVKFKINPDVMPKLPIPFVLGMASISSAVVSEYKVAAVFASMAMPFISDIITPFRNPFSGLRRG